MMPIGLSNAMMGWENPYVTDGLVAMWDGEWNAGGGVHDSNATVWKNLGGNSTYDFNISSGASWNRKGLITNPDYTTPAAICSQEIPYKQVVTVEFAFTILSIPASIPARYHFLKVCSGEAATWSGSTILTMRGVNWNSESNIYGWQPKSASVNTYGNPGLTPPIGSHCISTVYAVTSGNEQLLNPQGFYKSGVAAPTQWRDRGDSSSVGYMVVGSSISATTADGYYGLAHSIRLYSRALTAAEIAANYAVDKARFNLPDAT